MKPVLLSIRLEAEQKFRDVWFELSDILFVLIAVVFSVCTLLIYIYFPGSVLVFNLMHSFSLV